MELFAGKGRFKSSPHPVWRLDDGRRIEFGGVEKEVDVQKYQGRPHDLKAFDELTHFTEYQFRYLKGWNRSSRPNQRCRVIVGFNPPTSAEGDWVIRYFGPWLDKRHPRPAAPGELRWYAMIGGKEVEVRNGRPFWWHNEDGPDELVEPESRTFIRATVEDNPILLAAGYKRTLQALPEPLRSLYLGGRFDVTQLDHPWQVIPTAWVEAAMARWIKRPREQVVRELSDIGIDVARGGTDKTVCAPRCGEYIDELIVRPGRATPDGRAVIRDVLDVLGGAPKTVRIKIDATGIGSGPVDVAKMLGVSIIPMVAAARSGAMDKSRRLGFVNKRSEWLWKLREALDPSNGQDVELPPSRELLADLTAAHYELVARGVKIETKDEIRERIHRSPDLADAVCMAFGAMSNAIIQGPMIFVGGARDSLATIEPDRRLT